VHGHPHAHARALRPRLAGECPLGLERRRERVARPRERRHRRVALALFERSHAAVPRDGGGDQLGLAGDKRRGLRRLAPEPRGRLDVGHEEGDDAERQIRPGRRLGVWTVHAAGD